MDFKNFMKDKIIITIAIVFAITTIEIFLIPYQFGNFIKFYIPIIIFILYFIGIII